MLPVTLNLNGNGVWKSSSGRCNYEGFCGCLFTQGIGLRGSPTNGLGRRGSNNGSWRGFWRRYPSRRGLPEPRQGLQRHQQSRSDLYQNGGLYLLCYLLRNGRVEIDFRLRSADGDDEAVTSWQVTTPLCGTGAPPSLGRIDGDEATRGKVGSSAFPNILM